MTVIIDLTPEEEAALTVKAKANGLRLEEYLQVRVKEIAASTMTIGEQIVAEWEREDVIGYRPDITDSQAHARILREQAQKRVRE